MSEQSPSPEEPPTGATSPEPARPPSLTITVNGPRPACPVSVTMPRTPEELYSVLSFLVPMPRDRWEELSPRTDWLVQVGVLAADLPSEADSEWGGFLSPDGAWCAAVIWTTPPVLVMEQPFRVADEPPPMPQRPILGPDGQRVR